MNYSYQGRSHNKIFKTDKFIYKYFKSENKYNKEKNFYLSSLKIIDFIPRLYYYSDKRKLLILENVGKHITKKEFKNNFNEIRNLYNTIIQKTNYFHNDLYNKNVCWNSQKNKYYIIDWESCEKFHNNIHKNSKELYIS